MIEFEIGDILYWVTKNNEIKKKSIRFITYDEYGNYEKLEIRDNNRFIFFTIYDIGIKIFYHKDDAEMFVKICEDL